MHSWRRVLTFWTFGSSISIRIDTISFWIPASDSWIVRGLLFETLLFKKSHRMKNIPREPVSGEGLRKGHCHYVRSDALGKGGIPSWIPSSMCSFSVLLKPHGVYGIVVLIELWDKKCINHSPTTLQIVTLSSWSISFSKTWEPILSESWKPHDKPSPCHKEEAIVVKVSGYRRLSNGNLAFWRNYSMWKWTTSDIMRTMFLSYIYSNTRWRLNWSF